LGEVNGGGWGCIYSPQPLPSRCSFLPTADGPRPWSGRSTPTHQWLKSQRSAVTAIKHLVRCQMSDKAVADGPVVHPRRSTRTLKIHFTEPVTFGFFWFSPTGRSTLGLGRCLLLHRTVRSVNLCLCSVPVRGSLWCCGRSTARAQTVHAKVFFQKASPVRNNVRYSGQSI
jgi:hypothetical protein